MVTHLAAAAAAAMGPDIQVDTESRCCNAGNDNSYVKFDSGGGFVSKPAPCACCTGCCCWKVFILPAACGGGAEDSTVLDEKTREEFVKALEEGPLGRDGKRIAEKALGKEVTREVLKVVDFQRMKQHGEMFGPELFMHIVEQGRLAKRRRLIAHPEEFHRNGLTAEQNTALDLRCRTRDLFRRAKPNARAVREKQEMYRGTAQWSRTQLLFQQQFRHKPIQEHEKRQRYSQSGTSLRTLREDRAEVVNNPHGITLVHSDSSETGFHFDDFVGEILALPFKESPTIEHAERVAMQTVEHVVKELKVLKVEKDVMMGIATDLLIELGYVAKEPIRRDEEEEKQAAGEAPLGAGPAEPAQPPTSPSGLAVVGDALWSFAFGGGAKK